MSVPPDDGREPRPASRPPAQPRPDGEPDPTAPPPAEAPHDAPLDFDPYRFGRPDHYIPPEYAPPGYVPPAPFVAPPFGTPPPPPPQSPAAVWPPAEAPPGPGRHGYLPHPPPPPGYGPYGTTRQGNGRATWAMVLGILSVLLFWLTLFDLILAVPAIVFGALALRDSKRFPQRGGRNQAMAGLICGIVSVALIIVMFVVIFVRVQPCLKYGLYSDQYNSCVANRT